MIDLGFTPRPHQREAHAHRQRFSVLVWHRRSGKTVFAVMELILDALRCTKERGRFGYVAPLYRQAKEIAWDYVKAYARRIPKVEIRESDLAIVLPNGAQVRLYGADNPDSLRGLYFDGVVLDEYADIKPNVLDEIVRPALADRQGWLLVIGTPKGINAFSDTYHRALKDSTWYADLRRADETNAIAPDELEAARQQMTPTKYAQEMLCDFGAAVENALIPLPSARAAATRVVTERDVAGMPRILGVDVARYGDDRSVLFLRQGLVAFRPVAVRGLDTQELAGLVAAKCDELKPDAVFVDETGIGAGVIDRLKHGAVRCVGINFGSKPTDARYLNKRAEMWDAVRQWLEQGGSIPDDEALIADLCAPLYSHADANNRMKLEGKDEMRKRGLPSPDLGDALALTFAMPVLPRTDFKGLPRQSAGRCRTDYDVLQEAV